MKPTYCSCRSILAFFVLLSLQTGVTHAETHTYGTIAGPDHVSATDDGDITAEGINGWHWKWTDPATGEVYENTYTGDLLVGNRTGTDTVAIQKGKCSSLAARKEASGIYFYSAQNRADLMEYVRPLLKKILWKQWP